MYNYQYTGEIKVLPHWKGGCWKQEKGESRKRVYIEEGRCFGRKDIREKRELKDREAGLRES